MKTREVIAKLQADGWYVKHQGKGSHTQYAHPIKKGLVTVAQHGMNKDIFIRDLRSIYRQAGWDWPPR